MNRVGLHGGPVLVGASGAEPKPIAAASKAEAPLALDRLEPRAASASVAAQKRDPRLPSADLEPSSLLPVPAMGTEAPRPLGYGHTKKLDRLRAAEATDAEVAHVLAGLRANVAALEPRLAAPDAAPGEASTLTHELVRPGSVGREVLSAYLEWVARRPAKAPAESAAAQAERRAVDPALLRTRVDAIVDLLIDRIVALDAPVPDDAAKAFLGLFRGGAERIQARADLWMLNKEVGKIFDTERLLLEGVPVDAAALFDAARAIAALDGGSPIGFQRPLDEGETRLVPHGRVRAGQVPADAAGTALVVAAKGSALVTAERKSAIVNVLQQSPEATRALARVDAKLQGLVPGTREHDEVRDLHDAYAGALLYDSRKLWANRGVLDRLVEVAAEVGTTAQREKVIDLLLDGIERIRDTLHTDFGRRGCSYRTVYLALANLVRARESWDAPTLAHVLGTIGRLLEIDRADELSEREARQLFDALITARRAETPDPSQVTAVLGDAPGEPRFVRYAGYTMKLAVARETADGQPGKVLEVRDLRTDLAEDTETFTVLGRLEGLAREHGAAAIQLADWHNIHEARVLRAEGEYREIVRPKVLGQGRALDAPTFVRSIAPAAAEPALDVADLRRFLASGASRGLVRVGPFQMAFRKQLSVALRSNEALTLTLVDADRPGTGRYAEALAAVVGAAKDAGLEHFVIEGVDLERHHRFYERAGYQRVPGDHDRHRSYYVPL